MRKRFRFLIGGFRSARHLDRNPSYRRLEKLPEVSTVIDVGVGDQGSPFLYSRFPMAFFVSIDPLHECSEILDQYLGEGRHVFIQTAVGSEESEETISVSAKPSRTSLLERVQHDDKSKATEERTITIRRLDGIIDGVEWDLGPLKTPILLKVDTEGFELECLLGAPKMLDKCSYVILEVPLTDNFNNSYRFSEIIGFMSQSGFEVFQVLKAGNNNADLLFSRVGDPIRRQWSYGDASQQPSSMPGLEELND